MVALALTSLRNLNDKQLASAALTQPRAVLTEIGNRMAERPAAVSADFICGMALHFTALPARRFPEALRAITAESQRLQALVSAADVPLLDRVVRDDRYPDKVQVESLSALGSLAAECPEARRALLGLARDLERPFSETAASLLRRLPDGVFPGLIADRWYRAQPGRFGRPSPERLQLARVVGLYGQLSEYDQQELIGVALTTGRVVERIRLLQAVCFWPLSRNLHESLAKGELDGDGDPLRMSLLCLAMKRGASTPVTPRLIEIAEDASRSTTVRAAAYLAFTDVAPDQIRTIPSLNRDLKPEEQTDPLLRASMELAASDRRLIAWRADAFARCLSRLARALRQG